MATFCGYRLVLAAGDHVSRPVLALYGLDDAWDSGWAGPNEQIEQTVRDNAGALIASVPSLASAVLSDEDWPIVDRTAGAAHPLGGWCLSRLKREGHAV
jgi:hypothetical protein